MRTSPIDLNPTEVSPVRDGMQTARPIIFSGPMVRALLAGTKTQTRRVLRKQPIQFDQPNGEGPAPIGLLHVEGDRLPRITIGRVVTLQEVPYAVGERLWVRETHAIVPRNAYRGSEGVQQTRSPVDPDEAAIYAAGWERSKPRWRPSIHMPRWASRLTLIVTDVRVERLQAITRMDAMAEGIAPLGFREGFEAPGQEGGTRYDTAREAFAALWTSINGSDAWTRNPWVVAVTFQVVSANIDEIPIPVPAEDAVGVGREA